MKYPAAFYRIDSARQQYLRGSLSAGGQTVVVEGTEPVLSMSVQLAVHAGVPEKFNLETGVQGILDVVSEDKVDSSRQRDWYTGYTQIEGFLLRSADSRSEHQESLLWHAGFDAEFNTPYTERSFLVHAGPAVRVNRGALSLSLYSGVGYYYWEADDDIPSQFFGTGKDELAMKDFGLFLSPELIHEFRGGVRVRNSAVLMFAKRQKLRELRVRATVEVPFSSLLGELCPESWKDSHLLLAGEFREFEVGDRLLPFNQEGRILLAFGATF